MELEEYKKTIKILKEQKDLFKEKLKKTNEQNLKTIIDNFAYLDKKINDYHILIGNKEKADDKNRNFINDLNSKNKPYNIIEPIKDIQGTNNKNNKRKYNKKSIKDIILLMEIINNIISNKGKYKINIYDTDNNINVIYTFKNQNNLFYYYHCNKRPVCYGKAKYNIKKNLFQITKVCNNISKHNEIT